jgi:penicillin-binding protein 1A
LPAATAVEARGDEESSESASNSGECDKAPNEIAPRVIRAQNAWLMTDMLREVITRGTGRRALALGRSDLAGKTGTTNEARDTWFNGYNPDLVASVWVGFDQSKPLGEGEEGSRTAVPIWVDFMRVALARTPVRSWPSPEGLVQVRISPVTGEVAGADDRDAIFETFMLDRLPVGASQDLVNPNKTDETKPKESAEPLF